MLKVKSISKSYKGIDALKKVSFLLEKGEVLGLLGPNGAGKSTLMRILSTYEKADEGEIFLDGYSINRDSQKIRSLCGYLSENAPLFENLTVNEFLTFVLKSKDFRGEKLAYEIKRLLTSFDLIDSKNKIISKLSSGYKQRCAIAGALCGDISLLILDEPGKGLDPGQIIDLRNIIKKSSKKMMIIVSSHILSEISLLCDRILIVDEGHISYEQKLKKEEDYISYECRIKGDLKIISEMCRTKGFTFNHLGTIDTDLHHLYLTMPYTCQSNDFLLFDSVVEFSLKLKELVKLTNPLEKIYMDITGK